MRLKCRSTQVARGCIPLSPWAKNLSALPSSGQSSWKTDKSSMVIRLFVPLRFKSNSCTKDPANIDSRWPSAVSSARGSKASSSKRALCCTRRPAKVPVRGTPAESSMVKSQRCSSAATRPAKSRSGVIRAAVTSGSSKASRKKSAMVRASASGLGPLPKSNCLNQGLASTGSAPAGR